MLREVTAEEFGKHDSSPLSAELRRIAEACDAADGIDTTLNEQACLQLKYRGLDGGRLWVADGGFALRHGSILDLAVHPDQRDRGVGTALAEAALADGSWVSAWSHSDHPAAGRLAARFGLVRERELLVMRRPAGDPPELRVPDGFEIRSFRPEDTAALLETNAHAFAHHPEQGHLTEQDLAERMAEPWFDPAGLLVAVPQPGSEFDGELDLAGFHWTKVHTDKTPPVGEVYVVATNPKAAGRGLGSALTTAGLRHLAERGLAEVILYVDADNEPAIATYSAHGFTTLRTEAEYRGTPELTPR